MEKSQQCITKVYWKDVREQVAKSNPELAALIDEIDPGKEFPLYLVNYRYGDVIVDEGIFNLPSENGEVVPATSVRISNNIKEDLCFPGEKIPPGIVLKGGIDLLLKPKNQYLPWRFYEPGTIFALWGHITGEDNFHPHKVFTITSGARSIFMLPNIGDLRWHKALQKKYCLPELAPPKNIEEHHQTFAELVNSPAAKCDWCTTVLYFSKPWSTKFNGYDKRWLKSRCYLQNQVLLGSDFWRNQMFLNHAFSCAQANRNMRPNPYVADTAKHIIMIVLGLLPGFTVALDNIAAPVDLIKKIYLEDYGIDQVPTMLRPVHFSIDKGDPVYYSLGHPTTLEFSPKCRKIACNLYDAKELKHVVKRFVEEIVRDKLKLTEAYTNPVRKSEFAYFHYRNDPTREIRSTKEMPQEDPRLIVCPEGCSNKDFAYTNTFLRGCVRIGVKK